MTGVQSLFIPLYVCEFLMALPFHPSKKNILMIQIMLVYVRTIVLGQREFFFKEANEYIYRKREY
jgi:hypothetical protein